MAILWNRFLFAAALGALGICLTPPAAAGDLRITIPKRSQVTPVQRLNREGVEAVKKNQFNKAKELFFKAYLYDPGDPFTLNNLGYVAEREGQFERAQSFYSLAAAQPSDARIDRSSSPKLEGESLQNAIGSFGDVAMRVNHANVEAVGLLSRGLVQEADELLRRTLDLNPKDGFTLNNMGVVKEAEGEYGEALRYYDAASNSRIQDPVIVTVAPAWRGKPLSEVASKSAARLRSRMETSQSNKAQAALLNLRGVSAMNRNDEREAWQDFSRAYQLAPDDAFSLNNRGFLAEMDGDLESAQEFYAEARDAGGANFRVQLATKASAEGKRLFSVAGKSEDEVSSAIEAARAARRRTPGPIELMHRDGSPVAVPATPPKGTPPQTIPPQ